MATFRKVKLEDVTTKIGSGATPRGGQGSYYTQGTPLIRSLNVYDLKFDYSNLAFIDNEQAKKLNNVTVIENDVLLNITGASVCRCTSVPNNLVPARVNQHVSIIRADGKNLDGKYLKYALVSPFYKNNLLGLSKNGATREALTKENIENFEISLPSFEEQTHISSILSAYDDLIENNEKRIKVLEEMAQLLYTEWFVKFKFPGHEKVKMIDSGTEYGRIPEGWEVMRLKELGKTITGKTPPTGDLDNFNGEVLFIKTPDIHGNIFVIKTEQTLSLVGSHLQATKLLPEKTVFVSCIGTLGVVGITSKPSQTNQQINALILYDATDYIYLYFFAKGLRQKLVGLGSNGATMGNVNKDKFENLLILYPNDKIRKSFFDRTYEIFDEILTLQLHSELLSKTRDLLIPQLVTGARKLK